jgi:hypothetical protein
MWSGTIRAKNPEKSKLNFAVEAGPEIAQHQNVARLELDHLAGADIVHEFDTGGRAFHILHQGGGNGRRRRAGQCVVGCCRSGGQNGGQNGGIESIARHPTVSRLPPSYGFLA